MKINWELVLTLVVASIIIAGVTFLGRKITEKA
jgi:hypothetical protein